MKRKLKPRRRWSVQMWTRRDPSWTGPLGTGWVISGGPIPPCVDFWPASWRTRREARSAAMTMRERASQHSPDWKFRELPITINVSERHA